MGSSTAGVSIHPTKSTVLVKTDASAMVVVDGTALVGSGLDESHLFPDDRFVVSARPRLETQLADVSPVAFAVRALKGGVIDP